MLKEMQEIKGIAKELASLARKSDVKADQISVMASPSDYDMGYNTGLAEAYATASGVLVKYGFLLEERLPQEEYFPKQEQYDDASPEERDLDGQLSFEFGE